MNKTSIRVLFAILIPFLFLQFVFVLKVKEPYPSIRLPAFGTVPENSEVLNDIKDIDVIAHFQNGDSLVLEKKDFFNTMQEWHISKIVTSINSKKVAGKKREKEREINLGKYIVSVSWRRSSYDDQLPAFKNWLKNRAIVVTGRPDIASLSIIQYRKDFMVSTRTFSNKSLDKSVTYLFDGTQE